MATKQAQTPLGATPAVNGNTSMSQSLSMANTMHSSIKAFSNTEGLRILSQLTDCIPMQEKVISERDKKIEELNAKLAAEEKQYTTQCQKQLDTYNNAYEAWKKEQNSLLERTQKYESVFEQMRGQMNKVQKELDDAKAQVGQLGLKVRERDNMLEKKAQDIMQLEKQLKASREEAGNHRKRADDLANLVTELKRILGDKTEQHEKLEKRYNKSQEALQNFHRSIVKLEDTSDDEVAAGMEDLWSSAQKMVTKFLAEDLPQEMLQNDNWEKLRINSPIAREIPLPRSNSPIAKEMRIARVLSRLSRLVDDKIFQPVYQLQEGSELRDLLWHQASIDQTKERFTRAAILAMLPGEEEHNASQRVDDVLDAVFDDGSIQAFMTQEAIELFEQELEAFLVRAQTYWKTVQYSKQKYEPMFQLNIDTDLHWHILEVDAADSKKGKQPASSDSVDGLEGDEFIVFPPVYLMDDGPKSITTATLLRQDRIRLATQEARKIALPVSTPTSSARGQNRRRRTMSINGDSPRPRSMIGAFLSR